MAKICVEVGWKEISNSLSPNGKELVPDLPAGVDHCAIDANPIVGTSYFTMIDESKVAQVSPKWSGGKTDGQARKAEAEKG